MITKKLFSTTSKIKMFFKILPLMVKDLLKGETVELVIERAKRTIK